MARNHSSSATPDQRANERNEAGNEDPNQPAPPAHNKPSKPRTRSNFHEEQNVFEISFSSGAAHPGSTAFAPPSPLRKTRSKSKDATETSDDGSGGTSKPMLPPIAAMASPAGAGDYSWAFSSNSDLQSSLRAGPLSPAMLAGPQSYHHHLGSAYDPNNMRTGLTPDVSRTGLTPLLGGPSSFPPPSPNTAAFISMVTSAAAQQHHGALAPNPGTITPNTLSTILNGGSHTNGAYISGNAAGGPPPPSTPGGSSATHQSHPHPLSVSHGPTHERRMSTSSSSSYAPPAPQSYSGAPPTQGGPPQNDAHHAANGLFLLSQAHQELTKREEQQQQQSGSDQASSPVIAPSALNGNSGRKSGGRAAAAAPSTGKRKNAADDRGAPAAKKSRGGAAGARGGRRGAAARKVSEEISAANDSPDEMDTDEELLRGHSPDDDGSVRQGRNGKPETEEEKRKNFLERNRQAALKCRQRKKAWLTQLQAKVEFLTTENERLQSTTLSMREEITRLSAVVVAHRDCGLGGVSVARSEALLAQGNGTATTGSNGHSKGSRGSDQSVPSNAPTGRVGAGAISSSTSKPVSVSNGQANMPAPAMVQPVGGGNGKGGSRGGYAY